jgi:hypothetical protein
MQLTTTFDNDSDEAWFRNQVSEEMKIDAQIQKLAAKQAFKVSKLIPLFKREVFKTWHVFLLEGLTILRDSKILFVLNSAVFRRASPTLEVPDPKLPEDIELVWDFFDLLSYKLELLRDKFMTNINRANSASLQFVDVSSVKLAEINSLAERYADHLNKVVVSRIAGQEIVQATSALDSLLDSVQFFNSSKKVVETRDVKEGKTTNSKHLKH